MDENYLETAPMKKDRNTQDDGIIARGKASTDSEQSAQVGGNEVHRDEDAAMTKITGDKGNQDFAKELRKRKRKRTADGEIAQAILSSTDGYSSRLRPRKEVSSFQMVELNENDNERIVGKRIKVYWPDSRKWFAGRIKSFDREKGLHKINYDDGDVEELDLKKERFELEIKPNDGFRIKIELRSRKSKKDHGAYVVANTSSSQEFDKVKTTAEIEGESTNSAESSPGKQQPADNQSDNDETQAGCARQKLVLTEVEEAKSGELSKPKISDC
ncbi:hypothetical protein ACH5RR_009222 [Cinchona calisaya]|uniref:Tudor domain-containing protein n=1 Tax=Cinchona calisaya TaxID=153742 RepID=A0ABD3AH18_9GENT